APTAIAMSSNALFLIDIVRDSGGSREAGNFVIKNLRRTSRRKTSWTRTTAGGCLVSSRHQETAVLAAGVPAAPRQNEAAQPGLSERRRARLRLRQLDNFIPRLQCQPAGGGKGGGGGGGEGGGGGQGGGGQGGGSQGGGGQGGGGQGGGGQGGGGQGGGGQRQLGSHAVVQPAQRLGAPPPILTPGSERPGGEPQRLAQPRLPTVPRRWQIGSSRRLRRRRHPHRHLSRSRSRSRSRKRSSGQAESGRAVPSTSWATGPASRCATKRRFKAGELRCTLTFLNAKLTLAY
ncbi:hypothetical protein BOX15_Mlig001710g3, partial [Macrostomum lignano]